MPRCFMMAKKLKAYEQWKQERQQERTPSPEREQPMELTCYKQEIPDHDDAISLVKRERVSPPAHAAAAAHHHHHALLPPPPPPPPHHVGHHVFAAAQAPSAHLLQALHLSRYGFLTPPPPPPQLPTAPLPPPAVHSRLTPPPEPQTAKKDNIFRPYCLEPQTQPPPPPPIRAPLATYSPIYSCSSPYLQYRNIEDIDTAHAILDLSRRGSRSASPEEEVKEQQAAAVLVKRESKPASQPIQPIASSTPTPLLSPALSTSSSEAAAALTFKLNGGKTTAYTYEAFFASDGRSKKAKTAAAAAALVAKQEPVIDVVSEVPTVSSSGDNKPRYTCSECGKNYATSSNLSRHKQTHRSLDSGNAKRCPHCEKCYVSMPALSMHILTHNLSHKCNVCNKAFSRPWLLQGHMRSHSGDKPYGCAHCGKSFADRSNLRAHMQTHSAFKNFKCKRCNKSFALKSYLNKHYESACFKDQPTPPIDTPPATPAPSEDVSISDSASSVSGSELSPPPIVATLLSALPKMHPQQLVTV